MDIFRTVPWWAPAYSFCFLTIHFSYMIFFLIVYIHGKRAIINKVCDWYWPVYMLLFIPVMLWVSINSIHGV